MRLRYSAGCGRSQNIGTMIEEENFKTEDDEEENKTIKVIHFRPTSFNEPLWWVETKEETKGAEVRSARLAKDSRLTPNHFRI